MTERTPFDEKWDDIVRGWMLVDDQDELTERIEALGDLMKRAALKLEDLDDLQRETVKMMIQVQVARGIRDGDFLPYFAGAPDEDE